MLEAVAKRNYSLIGRILYKTYPDVAFQIENTMKPGEETDLQRIFFFYSRFDGLELTGYKNVHKRRLFTAVMLQFYYPHFFNNHSNKVKHGFAENIAACFSCNQSHISRNIKEAVIMHRAYEDFEQKVLEVFEFLKTAT